MSKKQTLSLTFTRAKGKGIWRFLNDALAGVLLYAGLCGMIRDSFALDFRLLLPLAAGILVLCASLLPKKYGRLRTAALAVLFAGTVICVILRFPAVKDGSGLFVNAVSDTFGMLSRRTAAHLAVSGNADPVQCLTLFFLPVGVILALLCRQAAVNGNRLLGLIFFLLGVLSPFLTGRTVGTVWLFCLLGGLVLLILSEHYRQRKYALPSDGKAVLVHTGFCAVILAAVLGIASLIAPGLTGKQTGLTENLRSRTEQTVEQLRYGGKNRSLPEGQFTGLGELKQQEDTALTVTMSRPDSYYLRGFVGEAYTGSGWTALDREKAYAGSNLFYWLHEEGFYGQLQLAESALLLDGSIFAEDVNTVSVTVQGAGRKYIYAPYEVSTAAEYLAPASSIGDEALHPSAFRGRDSYNYQALPNQLRRYTDLVSILNARVNETGKIGDYLTRESWYNSYVYDAYTALDDSLRTYMAGKVGEIPSDGNGQHLSYQQAKQNILSFLSANVRYSTSPGTYTAADGDFFIDFLEEGWGYSVHYATAAALLFRYYGIPARYVEGYLITPEDAESMMAGEPFEVSEARAHAWAEFYQDGIGWIPFEVTPPYLNVMEQPDIFQGYDDRTNPEETENPGEEMTEDNYLPDEEQARMDREKAVKTAVTVLLFLIVLAVIVLLVYILRKRFALKKRTEGFLQAEPRKGITGLFVYCLELLEILHIPLKGGSAYLLTGTIREKYGEDTAALYDGCASLYEEAAFSRHEMTEEQRLRLLSLKERLIKHVHEDSGPLKRLRLRLLEGRY